MQQDQNNYPPKPEGAQPPDAGTGNASNPSPLPHTEAPSGNNQLLDERAEKYLREVASIEDVPDPQDQQEADEVIRKENEDKAATDA